MSKAAGSRIAAERDLPPIGRAREIALRVLTPGPRTAEQLRAALTARDVEPAIADEVVARFREVGLIDDASLASHIVKARHSERGRSRAAIREELSRKGISVSDADAALALVSDEDERRAAEALATQRWARLASLPLEARRRRVLAHLGRRGYPAGLASTLVRGLERADTVDVPEVGAEEV